MNKFLIPLNILSLGVIALLLFSNKGKADVNSKQKGDDTCNLCKDYTGTFNYLDFDMLQEMSENYDTTKSIYMHLIPVGKPYQRGQNGIHVIGASGQLVNDSRAIWFSLDSLKRFIWEIETNFCQHKCGDAKNLGIRLYYARYPVRTKGKNVYPQLGHLDRKYQNLHTVFMVPTYEKNGDNIDFDPREFDPIKCVYTPLQQIERTNNTLRILVFSPMPFSNQLAKNHGTLCPPVCAGSAF